MSSLRVAALTMTVAISLIAAGCGANSPLSPTGPSATASISSGALVSDAGEFSTQSKGDEHEGENSDRGPGNSNHGPGNAPGHPDAPGQGRPDSRGVQVNGRLTALDTAARTFKVGPKQVSIPLTAVIRHGSQTLTLADLQLGDHVQVKGSTNEAGIVVATEVKVEQGGEADDDEDEELNQAKASGAVSALTGTCPALTFNILTTKVTTTATTTFSGLTCAALANGSIVEVKGTKQADGSIVATRVSTDTVVTGTVSLLAGTCPALTFTVASTNVTTSATTVFHDVTCATIANGAVVEVEGTKQADGSVAATRVSVED